MSDDAIFYLGTKVRHRDSGDASQRKKVRPIGEVVEAGTSSDPTKVRVTWPSGRDAWEDKDKLEIVSDAHG